MEKSTLQHDELGANPETATIIVELLSRVFKLISYYPNGHILLDKAVAEFIQRLRSVAPPGSTVFFRLNEHSVFFNDQVVGSGSPLAEDLRRLLFDLGQQVIEIDTSLTSDHLYTFVEKMLKWRMGTQGGVDFTHFSMDDLPATIRLDYQEFAVDSSVQQGDWEEEKANGVEDICKRLYQKGIPESEVEQCRKLLVQLSKSPVKSDSYASDFTNATWHEAETVLQQLARGELDPESIFNTRTSQKSSAGVNALSSIFESLGRGLADKNSNKAIELLLATIKRDAKSIQPQKTIRKKHGTKGSRPVVKISSIEKYIAANAVPEKLLRSLTRGDRSEELSIILQFLIFSREERFRSEALSRIRSIVLKKMTDREKGVLAGALKDLAAKGRDEVFFLLLNEIVKALRELGEQEGMLFLIEVQDGLEMGQKGLFWPSMVNELLFVGEEGGGEIFAGFVESASVVSEKRMHSMQIFLEELDAFTKGRVAETVFNSSWRFAYPLFSFLCTTSLGNVVSEKVFAAIKQSPQDDLIQTIIPILDLSREEHFDFFRNYLNLGKEGVPPLALKMAGGDIALEYLKDLGASRNGLEEALNIIGADDLYHTKIAVAVFEKIVHAKKMLMFPLWPRRCRYAAKLTLASLKKRKIAM
jgi:hypothetical protein